jgi:hypothetical protein
VKVGGKAGRGRGTGEVAFEHLASLTQLLFLVSQLVANLLDAGDERGAVASRGLWSGARNDFPDDFRRQARAVEVLDEGDLADRLLVVFAVSVGASSGGQQALFLVVPQCAGADPGGLGELSDPHAATSRPSVVTAPDLTLTLM